MIPIWLAPVATPRAWRFPGLLLLTALLVSACAAPRSTSSGASSGSGSSATASSPPGASGRLQVVTTILPITLFTRAVGGTCASVTPLMAAGTSPHDFQARPADVATLRQAAVLVKNGLGMEGFLEKLVSAADNPRLQVVDSSVGVATLEAPEVSQGHDHGHDHDHGHAHGPVNPHIWLDPLRAVQQVEAIRDGLVKADPGCAEGYRRNAAAYTAALRRLHSELASQLQPYRGRGFVAFHDVAPYFAERFGLRAAFLVDVPQLNPSPADLQRVAAVVKADNLKALLSEPQQERSVYSALARDLGVGLSVFDPLETATAQAAGDPDHYLSVMRRNAANLIQAFGG